MHLHSQTWLAMAKFPTRLRKLRATVDGFKQLAYWIPLQIANIPFAVLGKNVGIFWDKPNCRVLC